MKEYEQPLAWNSTCNTHNI